MTRILANEDQAIEQEENRGKAEKCDCLRILGSTSDLSSAGLPKEDRFLFKSGQLVQPRRNANSREEGLGQLERQHEWLGTPSGIPAGSRALPMPPSCFPLAAVASSPGP